MKLEGVDDANAAEALRKTSFKIPPELALPLDDDQYYQRDLLDMKVFDEDKNELGFILNIIETGANDVYTVKLTTGKELLIPAIKQSYKTFTLHDRFLAHFFRELFTEQSLQFVSLALSSR